MNSSQADALIETLQEISDSLRAIAFDLDANKQTSSVSHLVDTLHLIKEHAAGINEHLDQLDVAIVSH